MATTTIESRDETTSLIGSDKVDGTAVYGADTKRIGEVERVMIDKLSGKVAYAVLSFGGFLGIGEDYYPIPWAMLKYDTSLGGYVVGLTKDQLDKAPKYSESTGWNWNRENDRRVYDYYRVDPYWSF
jgi:hypothetical protein